MGRHAGGRRDRARRAADGLTGGRAHDGARRGVAGARSSGGSIVQSPSGIGRHNPSQNEAIVSLATHGLDRRGLETWLTGDGVEQASRAMDARVIVVASSTPPARTTLSMTMTLPGRVRRKDHARYAGLFGLSASRNTMSNTFPKSAGRVSSARPTRTSTIGSSPARDMFVRATSACSGLASSVMSAALRQSAREPQGAVSAEGSNLKNVSGADEFCDEVEELAVGGCDIDRGKPGGRVLAKDGVEDGIGRQKGLFQVGVDRSPEVLGHGRGYSSDSWSDEAFSNPENWESRSEDWINPIARIDRMGPPNGCLSLEPIE